jgi:hypothetical protein
MLFFVCLFVWIAPAEETPHSRSYKQTEGGSEFTRLWVIGFWMQVKLREMKPGALSQELKDALGMPEGAPPPWLINMQVCETVERGSVSLGSRVLFSETRSCYFRI